MGDAHAALEKQTDANGLDNLADPRPEKVKEMQSVLKTAVEGLEPKGAAAHEQIERLGL